MGESSLIARKSSLNTVKEHTTRMRRKEDLWDQKRSPVMKNIISTFTFSEKMCFTCSTVTPACVKCFSCGKFFCWICDLNTHKSVTLHERVISDGGKIVFLLPNEFIDSAKKKITQGIEAFKNTQNFHIQPINNFNNSGTFILLSDVCLHCFTPEKCPMCNESNSLTITPGYRDVAVINTEGKQFFLP